MVILIGGPTHVGKTVLARRLVERYHFPAFSIDHLKMGLIRSGQTRLTAEDEEERLTAYLWPIVREMIKTAIENRQDLIVEGCYVPFDWRRELAEEYLREIVFIGLAMSEAYLKAHFPEIKAHASDTEHRLSDDWCTPELLAQDNERWIRGFREAGEAFTLIEEDYEETLRRLLARLRPEAGDADGAERAAANAEEVKHEKG